MFASMRSLLIAVATLVVSTNLALAQNPLQGRETANDIKQIAIAYHTYFSDNNKAPTKADDLGRYLENSKKLLDALNSGSLVFAYGVTPLQMTDGTSNTVLIYEKDIATRGGYVGYGDGSVKKLTADEFKKAIIAGKK